MPEAWSESAARKVLGRHVIPPNGFKFDTGSKLERIRYGYPAEPKQDTQPMMWDKWNQNLGQAWRRIEPSYEIQPFSPSGSGAIPNQESDNWCGAVVNAQDGRILNKVTANWIMPTVKAPNVLGLPMPGQYSVVQWVGIDGWGAGSKQVLQAGTGININVGLDETTVSPPFAWVDWFYSATQNAYTPVNGFTVNEGDEIIVAVCAPFDNQHGAASFGNITRKEYVTQPINPPDETLELEGNSVEWIVERPGIPGGGIYILPDFGETVFTHCVVGGTDFEVNLDSALLLDMQEGITNATVATAQTQGSMQLTCTFV
jgi:hypothetical protein